MQIIDNINQLLGEDLKQTLKPGAKLKIAASCFSIYAYEALKQELEADESRWNSSSASPTFVPSRPTDKIRKRNAADTTFSKAHQRRSFAVANLKSSSERKLTPARHRP
ncbi:MAG: hypothetical protein R3F47_07630 [Gammaproteobacteria bacterium]